MDNRPGRDLDGNVGRAERLTVSVEEAGEMLGVSRGTAYNLVRTGDIPSVRLGRRIVVPVRRLRALIDGDPAA